MGYTKVPDNTVYSLRETQNHLHWVATGGQPRKTVKANDILDTLKEVDKNNNSLTKSLSPTQTNFVDIQVTDITWTGAGESKTAFNSEEAFQYTATVKNISTNRAIDKPFFASLYIDGEFVAKKAGRNLRYRYKLRYKLPCESRKTEFTQRGGSGYNGSHPS